jgi:hypothetical protein
MRGLGGRCDFECDEFVVREGAWVRVLRAVSAGVMPHTRAVRTGFVGIVLLGRSAPITLARTTRS